MHKGRDLTEFLSKNRAEVISMSIFEYDKELEEKKLRKAEYEAGFLMVKNPDMKPDFRRS